MLGNMLTKVCIGTSSYISAFDEQNSGVFAQPPGTVFSKICCTEAAVEIAIDAVQIHGGYGYMHDYGVEKIMRDVKVLQLLGESTPVLHIRAIQDVLIGDVRK